ncbi:MAG: glycosyltransferase [Xanthobacteraceae bacterium]|nr:glycosyltransferase [Xanthobacteraceae bacterium]
MTIGAKLPSPARIAVILPHVYRGGTFRGAKLLAGALAAGALQFGSDAEIIFAHLDSPSFYPDDEFSDLPANVKRRTFAWRIMRNHEAARACLYAGVDVKLKHDVYQVPDDQITQFLDCDLWVIVSDRLEFPLIPLRPHVLMIYDYLQRYENVIGSEDYEQRLVDRNGSATAVLVTTNFTKSDAKQFIGLPASQVRKVPMLIPDFTAADRSITRGDKLPPYFIWTTNTAIHKNHGNALRALQAYYDIYEGKLECRITGFNTEKLLTSDNPYLASLKAALPSENTLKTKIKIEGELPDTAYLALLKNASFLWHPARVDNGTFAVVEAAWFGVPSLSSDYPAMHEINQQFNLQLNWMNSDNPHDMARQLKLMETDYEMLRKCLPSTEDLSAHSVEQYAVDYWLAIRDFL